jgi:antitoxin component YwqK of YwqJK toxin-antitoxin module
MKQLIHMRTYIFFLFALLSVDTQHIFAQKKEKKKETFTFNYSAVNYVAKFDVLSEKENFTPDPDLTYYWYSTNKVLETKGGFDGRLLHGSYAAFYLNNNLKEKGEFKKGVKNDQWTSWYDNGFMQERCMWKSGQRNGTYKSFDEKGNLLLEAHYRKGKLYGSMKSYTNGKLTDEKKYKADKEILPKSKKKKAIDERLSPKEGAKIKENGKRTFQNIFHFKKRKVNKPEKNADQDVLERKKRRHKKSQNALPKQAGDPAISTK